MLLVSGLVLLALGIFSGVVLLLSPLGMVDAAAGVALWILFPLFSIGGYFMAAAPSENRNLPLLSRITGAILMLLALAAAAALVMQAAAMIESRGTWSLWYVLVVGLVAGGSLVAAPSKMANT